MNYALQLLAALREIGTRVDGGNIGEAKNRDLAYRYINCNFSRVKYNFCRDILALPSPIARRENKQLSLAIYGDLPKIGVISTALSPGNDSIC